MARNLPLVGVLAFLAAAVSCVILFVALTPLKIHEVALFSSLRSRNIQSLAHTKIIPTENTAHALNSQRYLREHQSNLKQPSAKKASIISLRMQSLDDAASNHTVVRDPRYPAVMYGQDAAMKELDELRDNATNAIGEMPDAASPIVKALAVHDYDEVMRLLDEMEQAAMVNVNMKTDVSSSKLALTNQKSKQSFKPLMSGLSQALAYLQKWHFNKDAATSARADSILSAMSRTRNALAEMLASETAEKASADQQDSAYEAARPHIPGGAASLEEGMQATASDVMLPAVEEDSKEGTWLSVPAENVDNTAYVVNQPVTTFVTDGRLPYEALPQTVESSA